jgi:hypothetical protein
MSALQQFVGARVEKIRLIDDEDFVLTLVLPDGTERHLAVYNPFGETLNVRIDGQFVPSEEL